MSKFIDLTGKHFGRLTIIQRVAKPEGYKSKCSFWLCRCKCGNIKTVAANNLKNGDIKSCGCLKKESLHWSCRASNKTHDLSKHPLMQTYSNMKQRCNNAKNPQFARYGGRGIKVCEEWLNSFFAFYNWAISHGYKQGLQLDRIDNNGDYSPLNCRFVTSRENVNNRSNTIKATLNGEAIPVSVIAEKFNISIDVLQYRIKHGIVDNALISKHNLRTNAKLAHT